MKAKRTLTVLLVVAMVVAMFAPTGLAAVSEDFYTVAYDANGGEGAPSDPASYLAGEEVSIAEGTPTMENHTFNGWTSEAFAETQIAGYTFEMPDSNVILIADWSLEAEEGKDPEPSVPPEGEQGPSKEEIEIVFKELAATYPTTDDLLAAYPTFESLLADYPILEGFSKNYPIRPASKQNEPDFDDPDGIGTPQYVGDVKKPVAIGPDVAEFI